MSATFNVADLSLYDTGDAEEPDLDSRTNPLQEGENDAEHPRHAPEPSPVAIPQLPTGPMTIARARQFEESMKRFMKRPHEEPRRSSNQAMMVLFVLDDALIRVPHRLMSMRMVTSPMI